MTKTEKVVIQGIRNSLNKLARSIDGESWQTYAERMKAVSDSTVDILNQLLTLDPNEPDEKEEGISI